MSKPKISPGMATTLMAYAAKSGDLPEVRLRLEQGANPACWGRTGWQSGGGGNKMLPLATMAARAGEIACARLLVENINDQTIARSGMGDWRCDYDMSPLADFAYAGMQDAAAHLLAHCRETMTQEQWADLLFNCVRGDVEALIDECAGRLDEKQIREVRARSIDGAGMVLPAWRVVEAHMARRALEAGTARALERSGSAHRM